MASTALALAISDLCVVEGEGRLLDVRIAARLGYDRPRDIRKLIERRREALERVGSLRHGVASPHQGGGRPGTEYLLNRKQALLICMWSETPTAADIQIEIVDVYDAWIGQRALPLQHEAPNTNALFDRFDHVDRKLDVINAKISNKRQKIPSWVQNVHVNAMKRLGALCPCCSRDRVLNADGTKSPYAEFDHATHNSVAQPETSWLLCKKCHNKLTYGELLRADVMPEFSLYQKRLKDIMRPTPAKRFDIFEPTQMLDNGEQFSMKF